MSGRIRSIKPEFLEDEKLGAMGAVTRLLFACTWLMADDYGNFRANPKWVHSQAFCFDEQTSVGAIRDSLAELTGAGMLTLYWVRGQSYYHVTNWSKHQRVDKPGKPHCPGLDEAEVPQIDQCGIDSRDCRGTVASISRDSSDTLAPDLDQRPTTKTNELRARASQPRDTGRGKPADPFRASFKTQCPDRIEFTEAHRGLAKRGAIDLHLAWRAFCKDHQAKQTHMVDWSAAFEAYLAKAVERIERSAAFRANGHQSRDDAPGRVDEAKPTNDSQPNQTRSVGQPESRPGVVGSLVGRIG